MRRAVALLVTELQAAGAERVVFELATRLDRARFDPFVVALARPGGDEGSLARSIRARGVEAIVARAQRKRDAWRLLPLLRVLAERRPAIVHGHLFHGNLAARLLGPALGAKVVSTHHVVERRALPVRFAVDRLTCGLDHKTVAVSPAVGAWLAVSRLARRSRLEVVENGIDLSRFSGDMDREGARAALGFADRKVVGALGRLDRQKGHDVLLRALPSLPDVLVAIAGEGPERPALEALAARLGVSQRVRFLGHREDVPAFLAAVDVFAMPSRWEGFGLALVEALAAGKPCVAARVDSLPDVLDGTGTLVPPDDPGALARALDAALRDPARLAAGARARAALFGVDRMVARYEELYDRL